MDYGDYPSQSTRHIPWKLISMIAGGVVVGVVIIVVVIMFTQKSGVGNVSLKSVLGNKTKTSDVSISASKINCDFAGDKEMCGELVLKESATAAKDVSLCQKLSPSQKEDCTWAVANAKQDEGLCDQLVNEKSKVDCASNILFTKATSTSNAKLCDKIKDTTTKEGCEITILGPVTSANCSARGKDSAYCEMLTLSERAAKAKDADLCDSLKGDLIKACKALVPVDDPDSDGLSSDSERNLYRTDPRKADTDGDGYSDSAEIASGHDPLKK